MALGALGAVNLKADDFCPNVSVLKPVQMFYGFDADTIRQNLVLLRMQTTSALPIVGVAIDGSDA